jgi:hypothetical protein
LFRLGIAKDEDDTRGDGDRLDPEYGPNEGAQLMWAEVFLEGTTRRQKSVPECRQALNRVVPLDHYGDGKDFLGELPGPFHGRGALFGILDDVEHEAQIDEVGGT